MAFDKEDFRKRLEERQKQKNLMPPSEDHHMAPKSLSGWVKKLNNRFDLHQVKDILALYRSGFLEDACKEYLNKKDNVPFEEFWDAYAYKKDKFKAEKRWNKLSMDTQRYIIDIAVPRYNRYLKVTGVSKAHPTSWLNACRWKDDIPSAQQWEHFANTLQKYLLDGLNFRRVYPAYNEEQLVMYNAAEAFLYRYPSVNIVDVMGILRWMVKDYGKDWKHLISVKRALNIQRFPESRMKAEAHIKEIQEAIDKMAPLKKASVLGTSLRDTVIVPGKKGEEEE